jgi:hypothetical protein
MPSDTHYNYYTAGWWYIEFRVSGRKASGHDLYISPTKNVLYIHTYIIILL